ncbi:ribonuclease E/G-like protein, chloroplastic isoform X1 [Iris pallida]|uniref:Ribonuclease E/G-like protein, chloroplastic isoform X1 n=1 Tax=Iris pallida TaxID=29817 RepID=A0AAX6ERS8_IRIPA|nr:ribonuclease E/G-like protein, chloroplastic isoform X1 [Iris pallida]
MRVRTGCGWLALPLPKPDIARRFPYQSRHVFRWMQLQSDLKVTLHLSVHPCSSLLPLMSDGNSVVTSKGLCRVLWNVEADLADGQHIFITGDPVSLGCWEPGFAAPLIPSPENANLWSTEIKVPCGLHFKYNYFIKEEKQPSHDPVWRSGPEFSLSIPVFIRENEVIMVRDSWMRTSLQRVPAPLWELWDGHVDLPKQHLEHVSYQASAGNLTYCCPSDPSSFSNGIEHLNASSGLKGLNGVLNSVNVAPSPGEQVSVDHITKSSCSFIEKDVMVRAEEGLSERDQPVEEPWLVRSTLLFVTGPGELNETYSQDEAFLTEFPVKLHEDAETLSSEDEQKSASAEEPISTVILISSSVCTMQRIAILEDGKLVEILLEPVKYNVQCDSIYLGIVTKFVPHMGGAFVDIGISRPSLMDIKQNREPFVFAPFNHISKSEVVNGFMNVEQKELSDAHKHYQSLDDEDDSVDEFLEVDHQDDSLQFVQEDLKERDGIDTFNSLKMGVTGEAADGVDSEANFAEYHEENGDSMEDECADDFLPLEMENSNDFDLPLLVNGDGKDSSDIHKDENKWSHVRKGTKVIVQVVKEGLGTKGPALSAYPNLRSRFWILITRCSRIGVSKKIIGAERTRLKVIAKTLQPPGFGLTVRTVAAGHSLEELQKDLDGLLSTWKCIVEHAKSAALAADEGVEGATPVMLHRAMGQTLSVVQDYFNEKVHSMVVDSHRTYHEVTSYLQEIAPDLCDRVELYAKRTPIFDEYNIEEEINNILSKRVPLSNGGSLVIEQTEALVSIDVNGGHSMLGQGTSQEEAVLDVNLAAAKQIARELRLRDIGGIIVVDFIDMSDESNKRLVYEEIKKAVARDRSMVRVSELSKNGLMEITRKRVRPSVTFMISEPCTCCHATGRFEASETSFSKIEREICRLLAASNQKPDPEKAKSWPRFVLRVDRHMCNYLTSGKRSKLAVLSSSLKVWILLKVARGFPRGTFEVKPLSEEKGNDDEQVAINRLRPTEARTYIPSTKLTLFPFKKGKTRGK